MIWAGTTLRLAFLVGGRRVHRLWMWDESFWPHDEDLYGNLDWIP